MYLLLVFLFCAHLLHSKVIVFNSSKVNTNLKVRRYSYFEIKQRFN